MLSVDEEHLAEVKVRGRARKIAKGMIQQLAGHTNPNLLNLERWPSTRFSEMVGVGFSMQSFKGPPPETSWLQEERRGNQPSTMQDAERCQAIFWHAGCVPKTRVLAQPRVAPQIDGFPPAHLLHQEAR